MAVKKFWELLVVVVKTLCIMLFNMINEDLEVMTFEGKRFHQQNGY